MQTERSGVNPRVLASVLAAAVIIQPILALAQTPAESRTDSVPPPGQYAPPPLGAEVAGSAYGDRAQQFDRAYADQYAHWAARYCVDPRTNAAAGALIGGVLGAVLGSSIAGRGAHFGGALAGGALGASAGAAIGSESARNAACPPGYVPAPNAPDFYYTGPAYPPEVIYGPPWYQPWVWVDERWLFRPYRYWYWGHRAYWRPGWRPGHWTYHYRRW